MSLTYRPEIDGLRCLAVAAVFIFHLKRQWLAGGYLGVDVFFVVSGFLITLGLHAQSMSGQASLRQYYQRRIARILPAAFGVSLGALACATVLYQPHDAALAGRSLASVSQFVQNMALSGEDNYFDVSDDAQPYLHYWSLSVEEQFYVVFPILLLSCLRRFSPRRTIWLLAGLLLASLAAALVAHAEYPVLAFYLLPTRAWEILAGCALALHCAERSKVEGRPDARGLKPAGLLLIAIAFLFTSNEGHPKWAVLAVVGTGSVLAGSWQSTGTSFILNNRLCTFLGKISFSLYLVHWPIFSFVDYQGYLQPEHFRTLLKIVLSLSFALLSYYCLERPARKWLRVPSRQIAAYLFAIATVAVGVTLGRSAQAYYRLDANRQQLQEGGIRFAPDRETGRLVLVGDSYGTMYARTLRRLCTENNIRFTVLSSAGGDPLPDSSRAYEMWNDVERAVAAEKPDLIVLACDWEAQLRHREGRLRRCLDAMRGHAKLVVLMLAPPLPPPQATRAGIRAGAQPPFYEEPASQRQRLHWAGFLRSHSNAQVRVVDVAAQFLGPRGDLQVLGPAGEFLYYDRRHLSDAGADRVYGLLEREWRAVRSLPAESAPPR